MERKILYFINPISGARKKSGLADTIIEKTSTQRIKFDISFTTADGEYPWLPDRILEEEITDVVICGGDGSVNQVVRAMLGLEVNVGIIPCGSGNGLANAAKIPRQVTKALNIIFKGKAELIDSFFINEQFSCMLCGLGFDAQVAHDFAAQPSRGLSTYIRETLRNFFIAPTYPFDITIKGKTFSTDAFFISIANSNQFGNNFTIAPKASLNDGLLDIIVVKKMSKARLLWAVLNQIRAGQVKEEKIFSTDVVLYFQAADVLINNPSMAPLHIDGDPALTAKKFKIEILRDAFRLLMP